MYKIAFDAKKNQFETLVLKNLLSKADFAVIEDPLLADLIISNIGPHQCNFDHIALLPPKPLIIVGCLSPERSRKIREMTEHASIVSNQNLAGIVEVAEETLHGNYVDAITTSPLPVFPAQSITGFLPLSTGCSDFCELCSQTPKKSFPFDTISSWTTRLRYCQEVCLCSQDCASYDTENIWRSSLPELLRQLDAGKRWLLRRMTVAKLIPIAEELNELFKLDHIYKCLWISTGVNGHDAIDAISLVNKFRQKMPRLTIMTDTILNKPSDIEYRSLLESLQRLGADHIEVIGAVPDQKMMIEHMMRNTAFLNNERWIGWEGQALIVENKGEFMLGRNMGYKDILLRGASKPGSYVNVRVINASPSILKGEMLKKPAVP